MPVTFPNGVPVLDLEAYELDLFEKKCDRAVVELTPALGADLKLLVAEVRRRREMGSREEALAQRLAERNGDLAEARKTLDAAYELVRMRERERDEARQVASHQGRTVARQEQEIHDLQAELKIREKEIIDLRSAGCCGSAG